MPLIEVASVLLDTLSMSLLKGGFVFLLLTVMQVNTEQRGQLWSRTHKQSYV